MKVKILLLLIITSLVSFSAMAANTTATNQTNPSTTTHAPRAHHDEQAKPSSTQVVNINTADEKTLSTLKGIGKKRAAAIVAYRNANGVFKSIDELTKVKGISQKVVDKNKARLTVGG